MKQAKIQGQIYVIVRMPMLLHTYTIVASKRSTRRCISTQLYNVTDLELGVLGWEWKHSLAFDCFWGMLLGLIFANDSYALHGECISHWWFTLLSLCTYSSISTALSHIYYLTFEPSQWGKWEAASYFTHSVQRSKFHGREPGCTHAIDTVS